MSSLAAASTIPVTNKVAHANSRTSLRILVMTPPYARPQHRRRTGTGRRHDEDTANVARNARRFDWFLHPTLFLISPCFCSVLKPGPAREKSGKSRKKSSAS